MISVVALLLSFRWKKRLFRSSETVSGPSCVLYTDNARNTLEVFPHFTVTTVYLPSLIITKFVVLYLPRTPKLSLLSASFSEFTRYSRFCLYLFLSLQDLAFMEQNSCYFSLSRFTLGPLSYIFDSLY